MLIPYFMFSHSLVQLLWSLPTSGIFISSLPGKE